MKPRQLGKSPNVQHPLEWEAVWLETIFGGMVGANLAALFGASLLKRSTVGFVVVALTGYLLGSSVGGFAATLSRRRLSLQRIILRVGHWIMASIGIISLILALSHLDDSISRHNPTLLFTSSFCGASGLIILNGTGLLAARYALVGLGIFAALGLVAGMYTRDALSFAVTLGWNAGVALALVVALKRSSSGSPSE